MTLDLRAGAGVSPIDIPPDAFPIEGFTGQRDSLCARILVLETNYYRVAIASIDQTSIRAGHDLVVRQIISAQTGVSPDSVIVCATHTFSAPHVVDPSELDGAMARRVNLVRDAVNRAIRAAAAAAAARIRPASFGFGVAVTDVNVNRDVETFDGGWLGANPELPSDHEVPVLRIDDTEGNVIALLFNCAVQSLILHDSAPLTGGRPVSGDLAGAAARFVEAQYPGSVALFTVGAAGDQAPFLVANQAVLDRTGYQKRSNLHDVGLSLVDLLGERLGSAVVCAAEGLTFLANDRRLQLRIRHDEIDVYAQVAPKTVKQISPTRQHRFVEAGPTRVPVVTFLIGDVAFVGVQAELFSATGLEIKKRSPFQLTIVSTMVNGAAKYMADEVSFDRITYAALSSRFSRGSAELVTEAVISILQEEHPSEAC